MMMTSVKARLLVVLMLVTALPHCSSDDDCDCTCTANTPGCTHWGEWSGCCSGFEIRTRTCGGSTKHCLRGCNSTEDSCKWNRRCKSGSCECKEGYYENANKTQCDVGLAYGEQCITTLSGGKCGPNLYCKFFNRSDQCLCQDTNDDSCVKTTTKVASTIQVTQTPEMTPATKLVQTTKKVQQTTKKAGTTTTSTKRKPPRSDATIQSTASYSSSDATSVSTHKPHKADEGTPLTTIAGIFSGIVIFILVIGVTYCYCKDDPDSPKKATRKKKANQRLADAKKEKSDKLSRSPKNDKKEDTEKGDYTILDWGNLAEKPKTHGHGSEASSATSGSSRTSRTSGSSVTSGSTSVTSGSTSVSSGSGSSSTSKQTTQTSLDSELSV